ncbi:MAG: hypothetical protein ACXWLR_01115 [Myxococcales bacterium]
MKWLFALLLVGAVAYAVAFVPPRTAARVTARALRAGWDWVAAIGPEKPRDDGYRRPPPRVSHKAQAATPQRRASRDGIVPQPPKETLHPRDRDALDSLVANAR